MKRSTIAGLIAIAICLLLAIPVAMASPPSNLAAKPTTTTAAPTTTSTTVPPTPVQVLGVPHEVLQPLTGNGVLNTVPCPEGEAALSISFSGSLTQVVTWYAYPIPRDDPNGLRTGYVAYTPNFPGDTTWNATMLCAPLVDVVSAS